MSCAVGGRAFDAVYNRHSFPQCVHLSRVLSSYPHFGHFCIGSSCAATNANCSKYVPVCGSPLLRISFGLSAAACNQGVVLMDDSCIFILFLFVTSSMVAAGAGCAGVCGFASQVAQSLNSSNKQSMPCTFSLVVIYPFLRRGAVYFPIATNSLTYARYSFISAGVYLFAFANAKASFPSHHYVMPQAVLSFIGTSGIPRSRIHALLTR